MSRQVVRVGQLEIRYLVDGAQRGGLGLFEMKVPAGAHGAEAGATRYERSNRFVSFGGVDIGPVSAGLTLGGIPSGMDHQMPTSLEALVRYRAVHADCHESRRVWLFHSHTYFDHAAAKCVAEARAFMDLIRQTFAATAHVEVSSFIPVPVGPHPRGSFEVLFTREVFADYVSWLMFTRPES